VIEEIMIEDLTWLGPARFLRRGRGTAMRSNPWRFTMAIITKSRLARASATLIAAAALVASAAAQQPPAAGSTPPQAAPAQPGPGMGSQMMQRGMEQGRMGQGMAGPGMMGSDMMGSGMKQMMMGPGHTEGRLAFIKAELKISDAQTSQWNAFADAVRANAAAMADMGRSMMSQHASGSTLPERLAAEDKALSGHYAAFKKTTEALNNLYGVLSPEQKKIADGIVVGPMGMPMGMM